jgi:phage-related protein
MHPSAKPWKGEGPSVLEIVSDFDGDTFRGVYTLKFRRAIYVLHCFSEEIADRDQDRQGGREFGYAATECCPH